MAKTKNETNKSDSRKEGRLYLRCSEEMKARLQEIADSENRSLTNYIETVLKDKIVRYEAEKKKK
jgi:predicted HicB family RNase H-like nuclease